MRRHFLSPYLFAHGPQSTNRMASERDLELQYKAEFHEVYAEHCKHKDYGPLLRGMKVVDDNGECAMDEDQWDAASKAFLY